MVAMVEPTTCDFENREGVFEEDDDDEDDVAYHYPPYRALCKRRPRHACGS